MASAARCAAFLAAFGSSAPPKASTRSSAPLPLACGQLRAVLADGPGPTVDPVGYAEAQILPLRRVHPSDHALREAITRLDRAYADAYSGDDSASATHAETMADDELDAMCPGAAP
ncbi:MAG: hypothetical protein ACRDV8_00095 [Acidimicrobiales bacterium]